MATELYDITVPALLRGFASLSSILEKGRAFAEEKGLDPATLLESRLAPDMAPLTAQIQRCSDTAKGALVRLGGVETVAMPDTETSFDDLQARIAATVRFIEAVPRAAINGKEDAPVVLQTPGGEFPFTGRSYVQGFVLPNFYFHLTIAYALLRHAGVEIGKLDYLGKA